MRWRRTSRVTDRPQLDRLLRQEVAEASHFEDLCSRGEVTEGVLAAGVADNDHVHLTPCPGSMLHLHDEPTVGRHAAESITPEAIN
jgi:hypothetical protein